LKNNYDYIITGAGCAGLSLLYRMMQYSFFDEKKILVVDESLKNKNDRTWCFWEKGNGLFENIIHHSWLQIDFFSNDFSARFDILPYKYKMIRSIDFYGHIINAAKQKNNIHFHYGKIETIESEADKAFAIIDGKKMYADYLFNSILFNRSFTGKYNLLQHFKGWLIETDENIFDEKTATFMDFRVSQNHGTSFVYVLPITPKKALVEYTLFSEKMLLPEEYDEALKNYLKEFFKINNYKVIEEEFGIIPMTDHKFSKGNRKIINMGTAGGQTKASSGFTFQFIQKHSAAIVEALINKKNPIIETSFFEKRFHLYDKTLLHILYHKKMKGDKVLSALFKKNPPQHVLRFLDNETTFSEELKIMQSVPAKIFLPAALKELFDF
jgi:lycopene beta-cyclase